MELNTLPCQPQVPATCWKHCQQCQAGTGEQPDMKLLATGRC